MNLHSFANLEGLGDSNVFRLEVIAEREVGWHNQRLDGSALRVCLACQCCVESVHQLEKLSSRCAATEVINLESRQRVGKGSVTVEVIGAGYACSERRPTRVYCNHRRLEVPRQIHNSTDGQPVPRIVVERAVEGKIVCQIQGPAIQIRAGKKAGEARQRIADSKLEPTREALVYLDQKRPVVVAATALDYADRSV